MQGALASEAAGSHCSQPSTAPSPHTDGAQLAEPDVPLQTWQGGQAVSLGLQEPPRQVAERMIASAGRAPVQRGAMAWLEQSTPSLLLPRQNP